MDEQRNRVIPLSLMKWGTEEWVYMFPERAGFGLSSILHIEPNQLLGELGSRMLHLAAMSPDRPSKEATADVMQYLLAGRGADPNVPDNYGRTPLTLFVMQASRCWTSDDDYGCRVLSLLFDHGADANVLFTPDFVHMAASEKWTLAHHLINDYHGRKGWPMPVRMRDLLESRLDWTLRDSAGRTAERRQIALAI